MAIKRLMTPLANDLTSFPNKVLNSYKQQKVIHFIKHKTKQHISRARVTISFSL